MAHLEQAVALDPFHLPALEPLIALYTRRGDTAKADVLSARVSSVMDQQAQQVGQAKRSEPGRPIRPAESAYKNIQVLKGIPAQDLIPAMRFVTASLGVECSYCHVEGHFENDSKKPKQTAREMMRMVLTLNRNSFSGIEQVTCNSCHRGSSKPESTPSVRAETSRLDGEGELKSANDLPTVDQVIDRYIQSLGGAAAIGQITSSREDGRTTVHGQSSPIEVLNQFADKQLIIRHTSSGDSITGFDGKDGWSKVPGRPVREMEGADLDAAEIATEFYFPLRIHQVCEDLRMEYPVRISSSDADVISCNNARKQPIRLYFDKQSGLLVRMLGYLPTPLGSVPTQVDYGDYREVGGVKAPFRRIVRGPNEITTNELERVEWNVPIDRRLFAKPAEGGIFKPAGQ